MTSVRALVLSKILVLSLLIAIPETMISPMIFGQPMPETAGKQSLTSSAADRCANMTSIALKDAMVTSATLVQAAGGVVGIKISARRAQEMPAFCRVKVTDRPTDDSEILTEIWLPAVGWNGRYRGQGNGGFAGDIAYELLAEAVNEGYVTAGTNTGHVGSNPAFALGHPEKVKDFGWRAVHDMTVQAKQVASAFYGRAPEHSYFSSCSDGGREALMEAQRFPADYDGILAGAPAYNWTTLFAAGAIDTQAMLASVESYIPAKKVPTIAAAARAACDAQDGVKDGVINDPRQCRLNLAALTCKQGDTDTCLLPGQVETLKTIYAAKFDKNGREVFPAPLPGAEEGPNGWSQWITGQAQGKGSGVFYGVGFFANFVHEDPAWKLQSFDFDADLKLANEKTAQALNATDTNLNPFIKRGGRLILYQGWNDPAIPALSTIAYYDGVTRALGAEATKSTVRLYMVPGMQHCGGGPGATEFGQLGIRARADAEHDIFTSLEKWVEVGEAPGQLTAQRFVDSEPEKGVAMSRPLCAYPAEAKYSGGDQNDAKSFVCVAPKR